MTDQVITGALAYRVDSERFIRYTVYMWALVAGALPDEWWTLEQREAKLKAILHDHVDTAFGVVYSHQLVVGMGSSQDVIYTPELLRHICSFVWPADLVPLCQTCRRAFNAAAPFIWESLDGAHNLFALLPNSTVSRPDYHDFRAFRHIVSSNYLLPSS
jgi:hypothetical protein